MQPVHSRLLHQNRVVAVWDLLQVLGGNKAISRNAAKGYMARDKVHYSKAGYEKQGDLFFEAFLQSYELFKSTKQ